MSNELVKYADIRSVIPKRVETDDQFATLVKETGERESFFLLHKKGREIWHGMAYSALTTKKQKTEYLREFGLSQTQTKTWADRVGNVGNRRFLDKYPGTHIDVVNELVPEGEQESWLDRAKKHKWAAKYLAAKAKEEFIPEPEVTPDEKLQIAAMSLDKALTAVSTKADTVRKLIGRSEKRRKMYEEMGVGQEFLRTATNLVAIARLLTPEEDEAKQITRG